jgi:hypothetical protein
MPTIIAAVPAPLASRRPHPAAREQHGDAEGEGADGEATERKRPAVEIRPDAADDDERARPGEEREDDRTEQQPARRCHPLTLRGTTDGAQCGGGQPSMDSRQASSA